MTYTLTHSTLAANAQTIIRDVDGAFIPADPRNADFQAYLAWLAAGNTPSPYVAPPPPPPTYTFLQFMALFASGEQTAIVNATDTQAKMHLTMLAGMHGIQLNNPDVVA